MKKYVLGILLCLAIAVPSWFLVIFVPALEVIGAPVIAIIVGMFLSLIIKNKDPFTSGIAFTSKKVLQYAVILLGFGLNLATIGAYIISGIPFDLIHAVSTVIFILIIGEALLKKCCRLRVKFGLFQ